MKFMIKLKMNWSNNLMLKLDRKQILYIYIYTYNLGILVGALLDCLAFQPEINFSITVAWY